MRSDKISGESQKVGGTVAKHDNLVGSESHRDFRKVFLTKSGIQHMFSCLVRAKDTKPKSLVSMDAPEGIRVTSPSSPANVKVKTSAAQP
jgi:hypothetical protein